MLSGKEIRKRLGTDIIIEPFNEKQLNPNSYDVTLDDELFVYVDEILDVKKPLNVEKIKIPEEGLVLEPNKIYVGKTREYTKTTNLVPMIDGKSSLGRMGVFTNSSAGIGEVGYEGVWSLQISCLQRTRIYSGMKIAHIYYLEINGEVNPYNGKYKNKESAVSLSYKDFQ